MTKAITLALTMAALMLGAVGEAATAASKGRCELARSSGAGNSAKQARELAMQSLTEAIRDSGMKARGSITYKCRTGAQVTCTAQQRACR